MRDNVSSGNLQFLFVRVDTMDFFLRMTLLFFEMDERNKRTFVLSELDVDGFYNFSVVVSLQQLHRLCCPRFRT
jgi:hypothetical protein